MKKLRNIVKGLEIAIIVLLGLCLVSIIVLIVFVCLHCEELINPLLTAISSLLIGTISCVITVLTLVFEGQKMEETKAIIDSRFIDIIGKYECGIRIKNVGINSPAQILSISLGHMINGVFEEKERLIENLLRQNISKIAEYPIDHIYSSTFKDRFLGSQEHLWLFKLEIDKTTPLSEMTIKNYEDSKQKLIDYLVHEETNCIQIRYKAHIGDKEICEFENRIIIVDK